MNHGVGIEVIHSSHDATLEFLLGCDTGVAQDRASKFGEALDQVGRGAVGGSKVELEAVRGCRASQAFVSLEMCAECLSRISLMAVWAG
jgi:hypothetical protein